MSNVHQFNPDREFNLKTNTDPSGREWKIHKVPQNGLYYARPYPDREDAVLPTGLDGRFTKAELCQRAITTHLNHSWDVSELAQVKAIRAKEAKAEQDLGIAEAVKAATEAAGADLPDVMTVSEVTAMAEAAADLKASVTDAPSAEDMIAMAEADAENEGLPPVVEVPVVEVVPVVEQTTTEEAPPVKTTTTVVEKRSPPRATPKPKPRKKAQPKGK